VDRNLAYPVKVNGKPVYDKKGQPVTENKLGVADFTPHDLRRTAATFMSQMGFMDEVSRSRYSRKASTLKDHNSA
jgi:integrase